MLFCHLSYSFLCLFGILIMGVSSLLVSFHIGSGVYTDHCYYRVCPKSEFVLATRTSIQDKKSIKSISPSRHLYVYTMGMHSSTQWSSTSCYLLELSTQTLPQVCHTTANWLTLGMAKLSLYCQNLTSDHLQACLPRGTSTSASLT